MIGWWFPALVSSAAFAWAAWPRVAGRHEAGGDHDKVGQLFADLVRGGIAAIISLIAWLLWSLAG